ncbi:MAG TPA: c-type cytochrome [Candidatus Sulfotelmatobacter sp.]|nr:c-type cytochrome [Candidatus Sulfotelmatobacter sp.]
MTFPRCFCATILLLLLRVFAAAQTTSHNTPSSTSAKPRRSTSDTKSYPPSLVQQGAALFRQDCSFCHGRDATGGESGPDLTRSKLVAADVNGNKIASVVRSGRPDKGMPPFDRTDQQIASLVAFIHTQQNALAQDRRKGKGGRKGVDPEDLQTGNVEAGRKYFEGAGGCAGCHSPTGDLAGIASRFNGLELEEQMLYPRHAKSKVTVRLASGQEIPGTLAYLDEFTVGLTNAEGVYQSWRTRDVHYKLDAPVEAHLDLFNKYTDDDVHNLMAYLQTLR